MSEKQEIRLAGFGGQGIILSGHILGKAASLFEKKNAVFTQSYGPEARGGSCSADVVISTQTVHYPKVGNPSLLVIMSQGAWATYGSSLNPGGTLILDQDLVTLEKEPESVTIFRVPATRIAEEMGKKIVANIVMLGAVAALGGVVSYESLKKSVLASIPPGTEELNVSAFDKGHEFGVDLLKRLKAPA
ncbi:MAG: 2-oxoacid:acceptor oxidoreductase family protein [Desulfomonile tiedjei]|uniref:2-oxoacid:acceptor oxidoreductase family protein n=1 Tax=Desulfomonile tiedjei TaxID=2358 RepID=A0A9D6YYZ5_9BACT|nr:2-oxoacid:acceptor oxidoreductase family protein [Desulfomonile tiedjei]